MKVVFSNQAKNGLVEIGDHIAKDNPDRAVSFIAELEVKALQIGHAPHAYPLVPRLKHHGIRRRPYGNYLIFYRIDDNQISIIHILHAAQDFAALLFSEF